MVHGLTPAPLGGQYGCIAVKTRMASEGPRRDHGSHDPGAENPQPPMGAAVESTTEASISLEMRNRSAHRCIEAPTAGALR